MQPEEEQEQVTIFACPPRCDAKGPEEHGFHDFSVERVEYYPNGNPSTAYAVCSRCGMSNIDFTLMQEG